MTSEHALPYSLVKDDDLPTLVMKVVGSRPTTLTPLSGGMFGTIHRATFTDGEDVVVKHNPDEDSRLDIEAEMLRALRLPDVIRVPDVLFASPNLLVLEFLPGGHLQPAAHADAGRHLARLHQVTADRAGLGGTTLNGTIELPSPWTDSWIAFYREHRLRFSAAIAAPRLLAGFSERIERLAECLDSILIEPDACSLLHGDVWAANVLSSGDRVTGFIDPSTCYGDPEMELAYATVFGDLGDDFLDAYAAIRPLASGFRERRAPVYAVYPALVHVHYFGDRFMPTLDRLLTESGV
ncbi:MAG: fructosamine kinase family protein [Thermomicrobiales bacterium]